MSNNAIVSALLVNASSVEGIYTYSTNEAPTAEMVSRYFHQQCDAVERQVLEIQSLGLKTCVWRTGINACAQNITTDEAMERLVRAQQAHAQLTIWLNNQWDVFAKFVQLDLTPPMSQGEIKFLNGPLNRLERSIEATFEWVAKTEYQHQAMRSLMSINTYIK
jgi:hypothetical protein